MAAWFVARHAGFLAPAANSPISAPALNALSFRLALTRQYPDRIIGHGIAEQVGEQLPHSWVKALRLSGRSMIR